jgi:hypothetical protein
MDSGDKVVGLFIDISKAFNSLDRKILLKKIYAYGFHGVIYNWFSSYLDNRFQFVEINGVKSSLAMDYLGVPEGSVYIKGNQRQLTCKNLVPKVITFGPRYVVYSRDRLKTLKIIYARALSVILQKAYILVYLL